MVIEKGSTIAGLSSQNLKKLFGEGAKFNSNKLMAGGGSGVELWIAKGTGNRLLAALASLNHCMEKELWICTAALSARLPLG